MAARASRSRSPVARGAIKRPAAATEAPEGLRALPAEALADVQTAHAAREAYAAPKQSKFRVAALLRFRRPDGSMATLEATNAEPHDANIRGAICAERAALCAFQRGEGGKGARLLRCICVTDNERPIFPGPLCREFLTSMCDPDMEVIASGSAMTFERCPLRELLPLPSVYRRMGQDAIRSRGAELQGKVGAPGEEPLAGAYAAAVAHARRQQKQALIFPILFAASVSFDDGRVHTVSEVKGIEYGCTVDAVSLLLPEMLRCRDEGVAQPRCVIQADCFGVAHAPFAAARSLLTEHGLGDVLTAAHGDDGEWSGTVAVRELLPHASFMDLF